MSIILSANLNSGKCFKEHENVNNNRKMTKSSLNLKWFKLKHVKSY